jgi:predicted secreted protein
MSDPIVYGDSEAMLSMGTYLRRNGVEIAEVDSITPPGFSADTVEVTHLRSPGFWREHIGGLKDGGELSFNVNLILSNPTHNAAAGVLSAFAGTGTIPKDQWEIVFPDADNTVWSFPGIITGYEPGDITPDDKLQATITVKVAGRPTLA